MNTTLLNEEEKQNMNTVLAQSQEQRMQFAMDMAIIMTLDDNSNLEQLYEIRNILNEEIAKRSAGNKMGLHTAQLKVMGLIKDKGGKLSQLLYDERVINNER